MDEVERELVRVYSEALRGLQKESAAYQAKKPFPRAKDSKAERDRQNTIRAYQALIANAQLPQSERDPIADYDIQSFRRRWLAERTRR